MNTQNLKQSFVSYFNSESEIIVRAPGRVNLIGEHTDYNDGFVLPMAIDHAVWLALRPRDDKTVRLFSLDLETDAAFELDSLTKGTDWIEYPKSIAYELMKAGYELRGFDAVMTGDVPRGAGLSSSAAVELAVARAFAAVSGIEWDAPKMAKLSQKAENEWVGVNCGIMDQYISVLGQEGQALLIDCRSLEYELIPVPKEAALVIGNTKASRSLASSAYNERRAQCEEGVAKLQSVLPGIIALRDVSSAQLEAHKSLLSEIVYRRCRHVISENERVMQTVEALNRGDMQEVGRLMDASHSSLRDDYEVSSAALDVMVEAMRSVPGCFGARLTGAGFGGCAIALVEPGKEQNVADAIFERYPKVTNIWPEVYTSPASAGARIESIA